MTRAPTGLLLAGIGAAALLAPAAAWAHFILDAPTPTLVQDQRGDPQKLGPCGGTTANPGTASNAVTEVQGGSMLPIKVRETIYHPGHYRVALAVGSLDELPPDPETTIRNGPRGPISVSAKIVAKPARPILADGLFVHAERIEPGKVWETQVRIPNFNCANCTLQIVQWMGEHGYNTDGGYTYHHCANLKITANPRRSIDRAWTQAAAK
jgi:hypothetical protein